MYRVFLADDEPWALMTLKNMVDWGALGFIICGEAQDGFQAAERIGRMEPDLILLDIRMPGLDGLELLNLLRRQGQRAQVLLISGYSDFEYARQAMRLGCAGYLVKPVEEQELTEYLKKVKKLLEERDAQEKGTPAEVPPPVDGYLSNKNLVAHILEYLEDHYAEDITLKLLAERFRLSESYLSSLIKQKTGKNFGEHLLRIRMEQAQRYLRETNDSIEAIASRVGYPDYFYFTKVFKRATGLSPSAYRRML